MKRIKATFLAQEVFEKSDIQKIPGIAELEQYEEKQISKEKNVIEEHGFDSLIEGGLEFIQGIWLIAKGFGKMAMFAFVILVEGLKYLWSNGVGKKKAEKAKAVKK